MNCEVTVTSLFPHFVDAQQSAMRGLNIGWYAIDQDGEITRGLIAAATNAMLLVSASLRMAPPLFGVAPSTSLSQGAQLSRIWPR